MPFQAAEDRVAELYKHKFHLENDGDSTDVIIMYQKSHDALIGDMHYIKSPEYSGYVHCLGRGCPTCAKGIRIQSRLFIPLYNIATSDLEFFDRSNYFQPQLFNDVFNHYPNPSEYVFRITRHGAAGSTDTKYAITAVARNNVKSFDQICSDLHITFPDAYSLITRELSVSELSNLLSAASDSSTVPPTASYEVRPRNTASAYPGNTSASESIPLPDCPPENFLEVAADSDPNLAAHGTPDALPTPDDADVPAPEATF